MSSSSTSLQPILNRIYAWIWLVLVGCFVYYYSWGGFGNLADDQAKPRHLEQQRLIKHLADLKDAGIYNAELYRAQYDLAWHYWKEHQYKEAEPYLKDSLETANGLFGENSNQAYQTLSYLGAFYRDWTKFPEAEKYYKRLLDIDQHRQRREPLAVARDLNNLGVVYFLWGQSFPSMNRRFEKFRKSEVTYGDCLAALQNVPVGNAGAADLQKIAMQNYAALLMMLGKTTAAESALKTVKR
jgi:tetratricopeptide (TPR) repeat protein